MFLLVGLKFMDFHNDRYCFLIYIWLHFIDIQHFIVDIYIFYINTYNKGIYIGSENYLI